MAVKWKSIPGFEGLYEASTDGRIRNTATGREIGSKGITVKLARPDGTHVISTIPRLILTTFKGPAPSPRHKAVRLDRSVNNNALRNLAWKTRSEFPPKALLDAKQVKEARKLARRGVPQAELAERYGVSRATIRQLVNGNTWTDV